MANTEKDIKLILSSVRALQGNVTAPLRSASVEMVGNTIRWKCEYDSDANGDDLELASIAAGEIIADFPSGTGLDEIIITTNYPEKTEPLKNLIYMRHEHNYYK